MIVLAGATGDVGGLMARALRELGAHVAALVRAGTKSQSLDTLRGLGVDIVEVDYQSRASLVAAVRGATCVVSALAGLRDVVVDAQLALGEATLAAGGRRFFPSDYSADFNTMPKGNNRNLELRRELNERVDRLGLEVTSVLCGCFTDMLTGQAPFVLFKRKRVLAWGDVNQAMDFTTKADLAAYVASAALETATPRHLRIAGDVVSAKQMAAIMTELSGQPYKIMRPGGLGLFDVVIGMARFFAPGKSELYPAWQGMAYMRDMYAGHAKLNPLDNARHPDIRWTTVRDVLAKHLSKG